MKTIQLSLTFSRNCCFNIPEASIPLEKISRFSHLPFADPGFHKSIPVDLLLGAKIVKYFLTGKSLSSGQDNPVALKTIFGWILMGKVQPGLGVNRVASCFGSTPLSLELM